MGEGYYDHALRGEFMIASIVEYIEGNPVKAGLVADVRDWYWSSAAIVG